ncbi:DUF421 domain-containing protein [Xanthobacteraceae bacterium Astr-EGSB]|uniref:DUF421 domain-containing protein n=1 Tax=Astrobacterium formosum TaxID=3069710 RepID=UPI0027AE7D9F|nr:DUF421 domain-containing protein [Xanthobacteraceae bacterium Astr-EGSB]
MNLHDTLFSSGSEVVRIVVVGTTAYLALLIILRTSGKRTLSKLNAFDFVVTVALGSTLATVLLSKDVSAMEGITALVLLVLLQFVMTWLSVRSERFQRFLKAEPTLLVRNGEFLEGAMRQERVSREEILAALRSFGISGTDLVAAVVLETDGSITAIRGAEQPDADKRRDVAQKNVTLTDSTLKTVQGGSGPGS